jgi:hypothetical protein
MHNDALWVANANDPTAAGVFTRVVNSYKPGGPANAANRVNNGRWSNASRRAVNRQLQVLPMAAAQP